MKSIKINPFILHAMWIIILCLFLISFFGIKDANQCLNNPLIYGAKKATNDETGQMFCKCSFANPSYAPLYFDDANMSINQYDLFSQAPQSSLEGVLNGE